jgi:signal transduction histidine kinase
MILVGIGLFFWLDHAKVSEARQLQVNLDGSLARVQSEIALEFTAITTLFTYAVEEKNEEIAFERFADLFHIIYEKWRAGTRFPGLIETIFYVDRTQSEPEISRYVTSEKRFVSDQSGGEPYLDRETETQQGDGLSFRSRIDSDSFVLVIPIELYAKSNPEIKKERNHAGDFLVLFNRDYFATEVGALLLNRYLRLSESRNFHYAIVAEDTNRKLLTASHSNRSDIYTNIPSRVDVRVDLTSWGGSGGSGDAFFDNLIIETDTSSSVFPNEVMAARIKDIIVRLWFTRSVGRSDTQREVSAPSPNQPSTSAGIFLYVWHRAGNIERYARLIRNRRLALSYVVLAAFAMVAVVYYLLYLRAQRLRDREHEFVATVTHELRTPVTAVQAVGDNLAEGIISDPKKVQAYGKAVLEHGRRLRDVIDQILLYAGLSESPVVDITEPIHIEKLVRKITSRYSENHLRRLITRIHPEVAPCYIDPFAIETIITNLLSNAFKHSGDNSSVTISVSQDLPSLNNAAKQFPEIGPPKWRLRKRPDRVHLVIRISDTGIGIPKNELKKVKDPFYRGVNSRNLQIPGSGLGLSLVHRIANSLSGTVSINSLVNRGTSVTVRLPPIRRKLHNES